MASSRRMATDSLPGERQYHLQVGPDEVGGYVLLPGDPARADYLAGRLAAPRLVAHNREFRTWTGTLKGVPVSVTSTGVGCPSAAIAMSELLTLGAHTFVRVGSCGSLQDSVKPGELIVASGAVRDEGTTRQYVPVEYPALAHAQVVAALQAVMQGRKQAFHTGVVYCKDALTAAYPPESVPLYDWLMMRTHAWVKAGVLVSEMESAAIFVLASLAGARAGTVLQVLGPGQGGGEDELAPLLDSAVQALGLLIERDVVAGA